MIKLFFNWFLTFLNVSFQKEKQRQSLLAPKVFGEICNFLRKRDILLSKFRHRHFLFAKIKVHPEYDWLEYETSDFAAGEISKTRKFFKNVKIHHKLLITLHISDSKLTTDVEKVYFLNKFFELQFTEATCDRQLIATTDKLQNRLGKHLAKWTKLFQRKCQTKLEDQNKLLETIATSMNLIFNIISNKKLKPKIGKTGEVIPIFEERNKLSMEKCRVFAVLSNPSKVLGAPNKTYHAICRLISIKQHNFSKWRISHNTDDLLSDYNFGQT